MVGGHRRLARGELELLLWRAVAVPHERHHAQQLALVGTRQVGHGRAVSEAGQRVESAAAARRACTWAGRGAVRRGTEAEAALVE